MTPETIRSAAFEHRTAKRWILDLRGEARETAWTLVPLCLGAGKRIAAKFVCPVFRSSAFGAGEWTRSIPLELTPGPWSFGGELVALIDERTQSQSELAALMVRSVGGWLVGSTTAGAVGDVTEIDLGDNSVLSFSGQRVTDQCGGSVHRVGITPRVLVTVRR
ncbi:MAG: S41 family peptidase, partial [Armatimonadaceae bacterium]